MRTFGAAKGLLFAIGIAAMASSAGAQTGTNRSFSAVYSVHARGVEAGDFSYNFNQTGNTYTAGATREMKGWVGAALNRSQDYTYSVTGTVAADGTLRPTQYTHQGGRRREDRPNGRQIRAAFSANDVVTTATVPPTWAIRQPPKKSAATPSTRSRPSPLWRPPAAIRARARSASTWTAAPASTS
jgi:hypothetical protein